MQCTGEANVHTWYSAARPESMPALAERRVSASGGVFPGRAFQDSVSVICVPLSPMLRRASCNDIILAADIPRGGGEVVKGIRLGASSLVGRYAMPEGAARHVARLAAVRVDITEEVARAAGSDEGVAKLLSSPKLRSSAKSLTTEKLQAIREALGIGGRAAALAVVPKRSWRTIAFEGESSALGGLPVLIPASAAAPMKLSDMEDLFSADDIKRLKLVVLTSAEPRERITAIRRLVLAPGTTPEKGAVLLGALSDDDPQVRLEAIKALVPLGLNPGIAREARLLVSGTDKQKIAAAGQIGKLAANAGPGEVSVLVTLVAGTLATEIPDAARRALVESLAPAAPVLAKDRGQLAGAVSLLAEQLTERPLELSRPVRRVLSVLDAEEPGETAAALEAEVRRVPDADARRILLGAFGGLHVVADRRRRLAGLMTEELLTAPEPETDCLGIANCLSLWGDVAVDVLLAGLGRALKQQRSFLLRIIDQIASRRDCPVRTKEAVARKFLDLLKTDTRTTRAVLLECEIFSDRALPHALKSRIAAELIQHVHEFGSPRMIDTIEGSLAKLGAPAIGPLLKVLTQGVRERERVSAARVLGGLVAGLHGRGAKRSEAAVNALMTCVRQLDKGFPDRDVLAASIGRMCTGKAMPAETVRRVARGLRVRVGKEPYSFGLLDGLGRLASSPNVELETRVEVAESLLRLLEVDLPEMQSRRFTGGEKTIFIAGTEAAAYTDMIPILLDGLRNVCVHAGSEALHARLVGVLIRKWHEASTWRLVWGPANTLKLAEVLGEIALAPNSGRETRREIAEALVSSADVLPVLRVLARLFETDGGWAPMGNLAAQVAQHLLDRMAPGSGDRIELDATATGCLGAVGARKNLGPKEQAGALRTAITGVLFKALRNDAPGAKQALRKLAESPALSGRSRSEIEARLARS